MRQYSYFIENEARKNCAYDFNKDREEYFLKTIIQHDIIEGGKSYHTSQLGMAWEIITGKIISNKNLEDFIMKRFENDLTLVRPTVMTMTCMFISKNNSTAANKIVDIPEICSSSDDQCDKSEAKIQREILSKAAMIIRKSIKDKLISLQISRKHPVKPTEDPSKYDYCHNIYKFLAQCMGFEKISQDNHPRFLFLSNMILYCSSMNQCQTTKVTPNLIMDMSMFLR